MWKKFLAVMAISGLLASSSAFAIDANPEVPQPTSSGVVTNFKVTPITFNPGKAESVKVDLTLTEAADVYAYAVNANDQVVATFANFAATPAGAVSYTWLGKVGNVSTGDALVDGSYTVKVFASQQGAIKGTGSQKVTVTSTTTPPPVNPPVNPPSSATAPEVKNLSASPSTFSASSSEDTEISFTVTKDAYLTVEVKNGTTVVKTFSDYDGNDFYKSTSTHSVNWNGTDKDGNTVADGAYTVSVKAKNDDGEHTVTTAVTVSKDCPLSDGVIEDFCTDPSQSWDPTSTELEIEFELNSDVNSLTIEAKKGNQVIEIIDVDEADDGDYQEEWDGTDDDGDYVDEGTWEITLRADGDKVTKKVTVDYDNPEFVSAFVTKESFDPSEDEITNLVFKVNTSSDVTVDLYQGSKKELTLLDEEGVKKNKWYAVSWDGTDNDGEEVDLGKDWKFKVTAENTTDQKIESVKTVEIDVEEDDVSDKKTNVTNDYTVPVIYDEDTGAYSVQLSYVLDDEAEVFAAIYEGMSSTGKEKVELLDYVAQTAGSHTIDWNVTDKNGKQLKDGIYTYKIISRTDSGQKDTEIGRFVVGNAGNYVDGPNPPNPPETAACNDGLDNDGDGYADFYGTYYYGADAGCESTEDNDEWNDVLPWPPYPTPSTCGGYSDTSKIATNNWEMCAAIEWVTTMGIFNGYADGTFGTYNNINRAEVLKVVLEAFPGAYILPKDGENQGFSDIDKDAWYMPYVRTAKFYGIMSGYPDGTAKLSNNINRVEFLKFVLESAEEFAGYSIPKYAYTNFKDVDFSDPKQDWFKDYAGVAWTMYLFDSEYDYESGKQYLRPADFVQRGEVALVLYKLYQNGVLGYEVQYDMYGYPVMPTPYPYY